MARRGMRVRHLRLGPAIGYLGRNPPPRRVTAKVAFRPFADTQPSRREAAYWTRN